MKKNTIAFLSNKELAPSINKKRFIQTFLHNIREQGLKNVQEILELFYYSVIPQLKSLQIDTYGNPELQQLSRGAIGQEITLTNPVSGKQAECSILEMKQLHSQAGNAAVSSGTIIRTFTYEIVMTFDKDTNRQRDARLLFYCDVSKDGTKKYCNFCFGFNKYFGMEKKEPEKCKANDLVNKLALAEEIIKTKFTPIEKENGFTDSFLIPS